MPDFSPQTVEVWVCPECGEELGFDQGWYHRTPQSQKCRDSWGGRAVKAKATLHPATREQHEELRWYVARRLAEQNGEADCFSNEAELPGYAEVHSVTRAAYLEDADFLLSSLGIEDPQTAGGGVASEPRSERAKGSSLATDAPSSADVSHERSRLPVADRPGAPQGDAPATEEGRDA